MPPDIKLLSLSRTLAISSHVGGVEKKRKKKKKQEDSLLEEILNNSSITVVNAR